MIARKLRLPLTVLIVLVLAGNVAWALGFRLSESKGKLKLKYDVKVTDHGTGRVTVNLTVADPGRLEPLSSVYLVIPGKGGSGPVDLSLALATTETEGKLRARVHLKRELAEKAELQLRTNSLDGKVKAHTWYYHPIPIAKYCHPDKAE